MSPKKGEIEGPRGKKIKKPYRWTPEKVEMLIELKRRGFTHAAIAKKLNKKFDGVVTTKKVEFKLCRYVYKRESGLKRDEAYKWTRAKVRVVENSLTEGLTDAEIADRLNETFKEDAIKATERTISAKLSTDIYKKKPHLKRVKHRKKYEWTLKKVEMVEDLKGKGISIASIVEMLNKNFDGKATKQIVMNKLSRDIYKRNPELKTVT